MWKITLGYGDMIKSWFSENFTKWRLDDVISQGQGWKHSRVFSIIRPYFHEVTVVRNANMQFFFTTVMKTAMICVPNFKVFE